MMASSHIPWRRRRQVDGQPGVVRQLLRHHRSAVGGADQSCVSEELDSVQSDEVPGADRSEDDDVRAPPPDASDLAREGSGSGILQPDYHPRMGTDTESEDGGEMFMDRFLQVAKQLHTQLNQLQ